MEINWPPATEGVTLSANTLDVWAVALDRVPLEEAGRWLTADERQRAAAYMLDAPRRQFMVTRAALRQLLGQYIGLPAHKIVIEADANGKPRLAAGCNSADARFNVAHSGDLALIAITVGSEVGVDVERLREVSHAGRLARRYFHPDETQEIISSPVAERDAKFLRCWAGKEAVVKALGSGIAGGLESFRVPTEEFTAALIALSSVNSQTNSECWLYEIASSEQYLARVACMDDRRQLNCVAYSHRALH